MTIEHNVEISEVLPKKMSSKLENGKDKDLLESSDSNVNHKEENIEIDDENPKESPEQIKIEKEEENELQFDDEFDEFFDYEPPTEEKVISVCPISLNF